MISGSQLLTMILQLLHMKGLTGGGCIGLEEAAGKLFLPAPRLRNLAAKLAEEHPEIVRLEEGGEEARICIPNPVEAALEAAKMGAPENLVTRFLDWRSFEAYTAKALEEAGFQVYRNIRVTWPKPFEVDVVGLDKPAKLAVAVDCKHWNPRNSSPSRLREAARRHRERVEKLARYWWKTGLPKGKWTIIPALIILREHNTPKLTEGVLVVPVSKIKGFLQELPQLAQLPELHKPTTTA